MNVKKYVMIIAVLLLSTLFFAGCGNYDTSSGYVDVDGNYKANDYTDGWEKYTNSYNALHGNYIVRSENYFFFIKEIDGENAILRVKTDGSNEQVIVQGMACSSIALYDGGIIFLSDTDRHLYKANAEGSGITHLSDIQTDWFAVRGESIYYIDGYYEWDSVELDVIDHGNRNLYCMKITEEKPVRLTTFRTGSVNIMDNEIYCYNCDEDTIVRVAIGSTKSSIVYSDDKQEIDDYFIVYDDYIYYPVYEDQQTEMGIYRIEIESRTKSQIVDTQCFEFTFWKDVLIYQANNSSINNELRICSLDGSNNRYVSQQLLWSPKVLGDYLYFYTNNSDGIMEINLYTLECGSFEKISGTASGMDLISTSIDPFYIYQDKDSLLWGIYNKDTDQIVMEPTMEEIGAFDSTGVAPAKKDGYWGYINCYGATIIDFFFDKADTFVGDYATVYCKGSGTGVIDRNGSYIIDPQYTFIYLKDYFILAVNAGASSLSTNTCYGYDYSGKEIISKAYDGFGYGSIKEYNGLLYAQPKGSNRYELYDCAGNRITGVGDWENVRYVSYPVNGVHILYYGQEGAWGSYQDAGMRIADEQFNVLNVEYYNSLSTFNNLGLAVAENQTRGWHIIKADGSALQNLPIHEIYGVEVDYTYANEYIACCMARVGMTGKYYGTVNLKTGKMNTWSNVEPVDGTNCIIVTDENTGLKGLYDRESLVLNCVYKEIKYKDGVFERTRGAITDTYTPS